jgi:hypothetical protein
MSGVSREGCLFVDKGGTESVRATSTHVVLLSVDSVEELSITVDAGSIVVFSIIVSRVCFILR